MAATGFNDAPQKRAPKKKDGSDAAYGMPAAGRHPEAPGACTTKGCGEAPKGARPAGWVRASVYGSTDSARAYCSGYCATYGVALTELRMEGAARV